jgi:hypothetical protein
MVYVKQLSVGFNSGDKRELREGRGYSVLVSASQPATFSVKSGSVKLGENRA